MASASPQPNGERTTLLSATFVDEFHVDLEFDRPITCIGDTPDPAIIAEGEGEEGLAVNATLQAPRVSRVRFEIFGPTFVRLDSLPVSVIGLEAPIDWPARVPVEA